MASMFTDNPDELNKRYMPEDDEEEYIPEEELTEEDRETLKMFEGWTAKDWQTMLEMCLDEEYYTLSDEEYSIACIIGNLSTTNLGGTEDSIHQFILNIANLVEPREAVLIIEMLKKKPEKGVNIPPDILEMIYAKAKEYKG